MDAHEIFTPFKGFLESIPEALKYGFLGAGLFLAIATIFIIKSEQRQPKPRIGILMTIYCFMLFSFGIILLGFLSDPNNPFKNTLQAGPLIHPVNGPELIDSLKNREALQFEPEITFENKEEVSFYKDDDLYEFIHDNDDRIVELNICGSHLQNGVARITNSIDKILNNDGKVTVVVTDQFDTASINFQNERKISPLEFYVFQGLIKQTLIDLNRISESVTSGKLHVYTINRPMDERIHVIKTIDGNERVYVKIYSYKNRGGALYGGLMFYFDGNEANEGHIYSFYKDKLREYFNSGSEEISQDLPSISFNSNRNKNRPNHLVANLLIF